jgi:hypothetical protein
MHYCSGQRGVFVIVRDRSIHLARKTPNVLFTTHQSSRLPRFPRTIATNITACPMWLRDCRQRYKLLGGEWPRVKEQVNNMSLAVCM